MSDLELNEDPCTAWPKLQLALNRLLAGELRVRVDFRTDVSGGSREFARTDIAALRDQIARLRAECEEKQTGRPAIHAIRAGLF